MKQALNLAKIAKSHDDVPIGAVIVRDGEIIAMGENRVQIDQNPTLHAEIVAINSACEKLGGKFLDDCDIYISLEPCPMCATAISFARIRNIYYAATDEKGGAITGGARIYETGRNLWKPGVIQMPEYAPVAGELLREFFKNRRKKN